MRKEDHKKFVEEYTKELLENEKIVELFKDYHESSLKNTVKDYAFRMYLANQHGDFAERMEKEKITRFIDEAFQLIKAILIVKIFHKECEWRAGLFNYPGITIPHDFAAYAADAFNCDFISPVTEHEVKLMQKFVASDDYDFNGIRDMDWLDYEEIKRGLDQDDSDADPYPEWFSFYDIHMGTSRYINLPNVRGEKISRYTDAYFEDARAKRDKNPQQKEIMKQIDNRPIFLSRFEPEMNKQLDEILQTKENRIKLKYYDLFRNRFSVNEAAMDAIHFLSQYNELLIPVKAAKSWQEGLIKALDDFNKRSLIDALPEAYNNYRTQLDLNIKSEQQSQHDIEFRKEMAEIWRKHIMDGCRILGEPENFDFLELE